MNMNLKNSLPQTQKFFTALYGPNPPGWLVLWTAPGKQTYWQDPNNPEEAAKKALELSRSENVYFGLALQRERTKGRGTAENTLAIPGLWLDVDCRGGAHAEKNLPTEDEAGKLIAEFPLPPSFLIHSGGGFHAYWLFNRLWIFQSCEEREKAAALLKRFQKAFIMLFRARGLKLDNTSDLARVLRVPGTLNHKGDKPVPVKVVHARGNRRYSVTDLEEAITELEAKVPAPSGPREKGREKPTEDEGPAPDAELILERCAFLKHCVDDAENLSEPEWYCMISNIARTENGREWCHKLSEPYPRYSPEETDKKIEHALADTGPHTCEYIRENFGTWCQDCREDVTAPLVLGLPPAFGVEALQAEPFPLRALPRVLRKLVEEGARANQCPAEFIAVPALTVLGTAIGNSHVLQVKKGWNFKANIYTCVIAEPGSAKSPSQQVALRPIKKLQKELAAEYEREKEIYEEELQQWEDAKRNKEARGKKPEPPIMREIYTTDTTTEALAETLSNNPRGVLLALDELTAWVNGLNQYKGGKGADREAYLSFWSGALAKINRVRKPPTILENPFVAITGAMPPAALKTLVDERSRGEDGFIHRILFAYPEPVPQRWTEDEISEPTLEAYEQTFQELWALEPNQDGGPTLVTLTPEAKSLWVEAYNETMKERDTKVPDNLRGPWSKFPSQAARLALIIHLTRRVSNETSSGPVDKISMVMAWRLVEYFKSHTRKVYAQLQESPEDRKIRRVLEWMRRHGKESVTARELQMARLCKDSEDGKEILNTMKKRNLGYFQTEGQGRGRRTQKFYLQQYSTFNEIGSSQ